LKPKNNIVTCKMRSIIHGFSRETLGKKDHLIDPELEERIILRWISRKWGGGHGLD
jgi:hypothetical protein